jgi:hypothetical protein
MRLPATPITPTIVFDLDGTLVHTVPDIAAALDIALAPYEVTPTSGADAAAMMGDGLNEFFWRALVAKRINLPALEADAASHKLILHQPMSVGALWVSFFESVCDDSFAGSRICGRFAPLSGMTDDREGRAALH